MNLIDSKIILLSGPIASGKSTLTAKLQNEYNFVQIRSSDYLKDLAKQKNIPCERQHLQELGDKLDLETDYKWVSDHFHQIVCSDPKNDRWIFDCIRKHKQKQHFLEKFPRGILHVHLNASDGFLEKRYCERKAPEDHMPYSLVIKSSNEIESRSLIDIADIVFDVENTDLSIIKDIILERLDIKYA